MKNLLWSVVFALGMSACSGAIPVPGGVGGGDEIVAKYDRWLAHVDELQASVEEAQRWVIDAPKELAVTLGLPETATLDEIQAKIRANLAAAGITASGSLTIEINAEAGASGSAEAGPGGAAAQGEAHASVEVRIVAAAGIELNAEAQQVVDAVKLCLERVAGIKPRLEAIVANLETVISEGRALIVSMPDDLTGLLAAKIAEYTPKFNARIDFMVSFSGSAGGTIEASANVTASVSAGVTG